MKQILPKKYTNMRVSGTIKSRAKDMKDEVFLHDESTKELIEFFDTAWIME